MSSPSRIPEEGGGRRFRLEGRRRSEPKRLNPRRSNQIQGFWSERTQTSYLPWNLSVTTKIRLFFSKLKCEVVRPVKDSVLGIPRCSLHPSIKQTGEKLQAEGPQLEWDACALQSSGRNASATTEAQQVAFGNKSVLPFEAIM